MSELIVFSQFDRSLTVKSNKINIFLSINNFHSLGKFLSSYLKCHTRATLSDLHIYILLTSLLYLRLYNTKCLDNCNKLITFLSSCKIIPFIQDIFQYFPRNGLMNRYGQLTLTYSMVKSDIQLIEDLIRFERIYDIFLDISRILTSSNQTLNENFKPEVFSGRQSSLSFDNYFTYHGEARSAVLLPSIQNITSKSDFSFSKSELGVVKLYSKTELSQVTLSSFVAVCFKYQISHSDLGNMSVLNSSIFCYDIPETMIADTCLQSWIWFFQSREKKNETVVGKAKDLVNASVKTVSDNFSKLSSIISNSDIVSLLRLKSIDYLMRTQPRNKVNYNSYSNDRLFNMVLMS